MKKISISIVLLITLGFCREVQPFNNGWKFALENLSYSKAMKYTEWQSVSIPHTWNNKDAQSGEDYYAGTAWYKNNFVLNKESEGKRVYIRFQGVGQVADVYINGKLVGIHQGAYSAFCYDLTDNIKFGEENTLLIRANNEERPDIVPINHFLFMVFGGIYRPVDLIITNPVHITTTDFASSGIYINQENISKNQAKIIVQTKLDNNTDQKQKIVLKTTIHDREQNIVANSSKSIRLNPGHHQAIKQKILIDNPRLWHGRNDPYLYKLTVEIIQDGKIIDYVDEPLGLRSFVIDKEKGFILNGEPYRLYGVCRHQEWQDYGSALSDKQHQIDFDMMYEMGATSLRLAHYQQAEYVYDYSDTLGFIIWAEIPMVRKWMGPEGPNVTQQMTEMILQNYNHPSIFTWGMHNEVYANSEEDAQVTLTKELHRLSKELDPDRYTIATSGYGYLHRPMNYHGDLQGINRYVGWYGGTDPSKLEDWILNTKVEKPNVLFSIAEYGGGGNVNHQVDGLPDRPDPVNGQFFPEAYQTNMHEVQWSIIKKYPYIWGSYVWNMFDFTVPLWNRGGIPGRNHKGLVTYDRKIRKDAFYWYKANWSKEPVLYLSNRRLTQRKGPNTDFSLYCNLDNYDLSLNGETLGKGKTGRSAIHFIWENISIRKGKNRLIATGYRDGQRFEDQIEFTVN